MVYLYSYTLKAIDPPLPGPFYLQMLCLVDTTARQEKKNHLSSPIMVGEHLQKGELKTGCMGVQSLDWEMRMQLLQCPEGWGWMCWAVRRAVGFC